MVKGLRAAWTLLPVMVLLCCAAALAQEPAELNVMDNAAVEVQQRFEDATRQIAGPVRNYARGFFWTLATLDFIWFCLLTALRQPDFPDFVGGLVRRLLTIGFFWLLLEYSDTWLLAITDSFKQLAMLGGVFGEEQKLMSSANIFDSGLKLVGRVLDADVGLLDSFALALAALLMFLLMAGIAALVLLTIVELHFVVSLGVIIMALAGTQWTWAWAANVYKYAVTVGLKLFVMHLLVVVGLNIMDSMMNVPDLTVMDAIALAGISLILFVLAKDLPSTFESLIAGGFAPGGQSHAGASLSVQSMAMIGMAAAVAMSKQFGGAAGLSGLPGAGGAPGQGGSLPAAGQAAGGAAQPSWGQVAGAGVGRSVGAAVGGEWGARAGEKLGARVGGQFGEKVSEGIAEKVGPAVGATLEEAAGFTGAAAKNMFHSGTPVSHEQR